MVDLLAVRVTVHIPYLLLTVLVTSVFVHTTTALRLAAFLDGDVSGVQLQHTAPGKHVLNSPRAVPTFLIIGATKGGTTDLYFQLVDSTLGKDPQRKEPPIRSQAKELSLIQKAAISPIPTNRSRSAEAYRKYLNLAGHHCANVTEPDRFETCMAKRPRAYSIDATPVYFYNPDAPALFREFSPDTKVIMMVREPVDRVESLYNHWVLEDPEWPSASLDSLTDEFLAQIDSKPDLKAALDALAACGPDDTPCQAAGWRAPALQALLAHPQYKLYGSGLYAYALAAWRATFFQPDRAMVIDSHAYFRNRSAVMEQVISFLYGRSMTAVERVWAEQAPPRNAKSRPGASARGGGSGGGAQPSWRLSPAKREALQGFFAEHQMRGMRGMLEGLRREGAWVVGFDGAPWPWAGDARR